MKILKNLLTERLMVPSRNAGSISTQHGEQFIFNGNIYREGFLPEIDLLTHEPMGRRPALPLIIVKKISE